MEFVHPYLPNSPDQKKSMTSAIGISTIEELFHDIPEKYRLKQKLDLPIHRSEYEVRRIVQDILNKNKSVQEMPTYLGGGV